MTPASIAGLERFRVRNCPSTLQVTCIIPTTSILSIFSNIFPYKRQTATLLPSPLPRKLPLGEGSQKNKNMRRLLSSVRNHVKTGEIFSIFKLENKMLSVFCFLATPKLLKRYCHFNSEARKNLPISRCCKKYFQSTVAYLNTCLFLFFNLAPLTTTVTASITNFCEQHLL